MTPRRPHTPPAPVTVPVRLLDWRDPSHFGRPAPCTLCGKTTPLRSHTGESVHKVCAEDWLTEHPGESRFLSDPPRSRSRTDDHA
ncbi:hypothetical protein ACFCZ6_14205 [Streptomyces hydrogenans]|uniref:hypothetical protein n=1 Tax=Streptomyces hydrogenans TaxID=1873719 RepID=UPI0035DD1DD8